MLACVSRQKNIGVVFLEGFSTGSDDTDRLDADSIPDSLEVEKVVDVLPLVMGAEAAIVEVLETSISSLDAFRLRGITDATIKIYRSCYWRARRLEAFAACSCDCSHRNRSHRKGVFSSNSTWRAVKCK